MTDTDELRISDEEWLAAAVSDWLTGERLAQLLMRTRERQWRGADRSEVQVLIAAVDSARARAEAAEAKLALHKANGCEFDG